MKKLKLNKETISKLNFESLKNLNGGETAYTVSNCPSFCKKLCQPPPPPPEPGHPSVNIICNF